MCPPEKLSKLIKKRNGFCLYSEIKIEYLNSFCASYCSYIAYLTKVLGIDFIIAVLGFYNQVMNQKHLK